MNAETLKAAATYIIAGAVVVFGLFIVYQTRDEPTADELRLLIAGFIGATLQFLYSQETQTRTARQTTTASAAGASQAAPQPTVTTTAGPPPSVTVTPVQPSEATE